MHYGLLPRANRGIFAHQRAARPRRQDPGRPVQHPAGRRRPDQGLPGPPAARRAAGVHREPRGLHGARQDHHAAQGPHRLRDPHALPADARATRWRSPRRRRGPTATGAADGRRCPHFVREVVEEVAFQARADRRIDKRSGVSQRLPITALENVVSNAERRALAHGETLVVPRVTDIYAALPSITGKFELEYEGELHGADARRARADPRGRRQRLRPATSTAPTRARSSSGSTSAARCSSTTRAPSARCVAHAPRRARACASSPRTPASDAGAPAAAARLGDRLRARRALRARRRSAAATSAATTPPSSAAAAAQPARSAEPDVRRRAADARREEEVLQLTVVGLEALARAVRLRQQPGACEPRSPHAVSSTRNSPATLLDDLDLEDLMSKLSDLLLSSGFDNPYFSGADDDRTMQALHDAILEALFNGGVLPEETLEQLLGEPGDGEDAHAAARGADPADHRAACRSRATSRRAPDLEAERERREQGPGGGGSGRGAAGALRGHRQERSTSSATARCAICSARSARAASAGTTRATWPPASRRRGAPKPYEFGDTLNLDPSATLLNAVAARTARRHARAGRRPSTSTTRT